MKKMNSGIIAKICCILEKAREYQKTSNSTLLSRMKKSLTVWITTNWKILKEMGISDSLTCLLRNLYAGQEAYKEWLTGSKFGKEYDKAVYYNPVYLTCLQSTSYKILGRMSHKLESRLLGKISTTSDMQMIPL